MAIVFLLLALQTHTGEALKLPQALKLPEKQSGDWSLGNLASDSGDLVKTSPNEQGGKKTIWGSHPNGERGRGRLPYRVRQAPAMHSIELFDRAASQKTQSSPAQIRTPMKSKVWFNQADCNGGPPQLEQEAHLVDPAKKCYKTVIKVSIPPNPPGFGGLEGFFEFYQKCECGADGGIACFPFQRDCTTEMQLFDNEGNQLPPQWYSCGDPYSEGECSTEPEAASLPLALLSFQESFVNPLVLQEYDTEFAPHHYLNGSPWFGVECQHFPGEETEDPFLPGGMSVRFEYPGIQTFPEPPTCQQQDLDNCGAPPRCGPCTEDQCNALEGCQWQNYDVATFLEIGRQSGAGGGGGVCEDAFTGGNEPNAGACGAGELCHNCDSFSTCTQGDSGCTWTGTEQEGVCSPSGPPCGPWPDCGPCAEGECDAQEGCQWHHVETFLEVGRQSEVGTGVCAHAWQEEEPGAGGDPHVTNMEGSKFDIMQVGQFTMVSVRKYNNVSLPDLQVDASISHVEGECSATYIQDASVTGKWIGEGNSKLAVRVQHWVPKEEALQISIDDIWRPVESAKDRVNFVTKVTSSQVQFVIHDITIRMSLGLNTRKVDKNKGYSFLNLNINGLRNLDSKMHLGGLLVNDEFSKVAEVPKACSHKAFIAGAEAEGPRFLSSVNMLEDSDSD